MSKHATCPGCGGRVAVPDGYAESRLACPQCGASLRLRRGDAEKHRPASPTAPPAPVSAAAAAPPEGPAYACATCGGTFAAEQVYDQQGTVICHDCFARSAGAGASPAPARRPIKKSAPPAYLPWLVAGGIVAAVTVCGVLWLRARSNDNTGHPAVAGGGPSGGTIRLPDPGSSGGGGTSPSGDVTRRINSLWRDAKARAERGDARGADGRYREMFDLLEAQSGQPHYRSIANDLAAARREWDVIRSRLAAPTDGPVLPANATPTSAPPSDSGDPSSPTVPTVTTGDGRAAPNHPRPAETAERGSLDEAKVLEMLAAADATAKAGKKLDALMAYKQALDLLGGGAGEVRSDDLRNAIAAARETRNALLGDVKDAQEARDLTIAELLSRGHAALALSNWPAAAEAMADARQMIEQGTKLADRFKDERYLQALHGVALAYLMNGDTPKAGELFDDRGPLGRAVKERLAAGVARGATDRDLVYNRAVVDMIQKYNVMRAVKGAKDFLASHDGTPDERMVDLLGTAINLAREYERVSESSALLKEAEALYAARVVRLEAGRPGERRWGAEWRPAREVEKLYAEKKRTEAHVQVVLKELGQADQQLKKAQRGYPVRVKRGIKWVTEYVPKPDEVRAAKGNYDLAKERVEQARAAVPQMAWKPRPEPVLPAAALAMLTPPVEQSGATATEAVAVVPPAVPADSPPTLVESPADPDSPAPTVVAARPITTVARVQRNAVAFPVDRFRLVTAADVVGGAAAVRIEDAEGGSYRARVVKRDGPLALLEVDAGAAGGGLPYLNLATDFRGGPVRCAAIPSVSLFQPVVQVVAGNAAPPQSQGGWQVSLEKHPRLPGAPLTDPTGQVVGVVVARRDSPVQQLPAVTLAELRGFLQGAGALPASPSAAPDPSRVYHVVVEQ